MSLAANAATDLARPTSPILSAKQDIASGVSAQIAATADQVALASERAAAVFERKRLQATVKRDGQRTTITLLRSTVGSSTPNRWLWIVAVRTQPLDGGQVEVGASVEQYRTTQPKALGLIPAGPKSLVRRRELFQLFDALETELRALDPSGQVTKL